MALTLDQVRRQYPEYKDVPDSQLAKALHQKFYANMDFNDFAKQIKYKPVTVDDFRETKGNFVANVGRSAAQGIGFGFGDEAIAGVRALAGGDRKKTLSERYNTALADERTKLEQFQKEHPEVAMPVEIASGFLVPGGIIKSGFTAAKVAAPLAKNATLGQKFMGNPWTRASATGAGFGALSGAGSADTKIDGSFEDSLQQRAGSALIGGAGGAAAGPAIAALGMGGVKGVQYLKDRFAPGEATRKAEQKLMQTISRDELSEKRIKDLAKKSTLLGDDARLLDVGPNATALAQTVSSIPSAGKKQIREVLGTRQADAGDQIGTRLRGGLGSKGTYETAEEISKRRREDAAPDYKKAYAEPNLKSDEVLQMIEKDKDFQSAYSRALTMAERERRHLNNEYPKKIAAAEKSGDVEKAAKLRTEYAEKYGETELPKLNFSDPKELSNQLHQLRDDGIPYRAVDNMKRFLDKNIQAGKHSTNSTDKGLAESLDLSRRILLSEADAQNPTFAIARAKAKSAIEANDALEAGRKMGANKTTAEEVQAYYNKLKARAENNPDAAADLEYFRVGLRESVLAGVESGGNKNIVKNSRLMKKLDAVSDSPAEGRALVSGLEEDRRLVANAQKVMGNSDTQPRIAAEEDFKASTFLPETFNLAKNFVTGHWPSAAGNVANIGRGLYSGAKKQLSTINEQQADELGDLLTTPLSVVGKDGQRIVNPAIDDVLARTAAQEQNVLNRQNAAKAPFGAAYTGPAAEAIILQNQSPFGYVSEAEKTNKRILQEGQNVSVEGAPAHFNDKARGGLIRYADGGEIEDAAPALGAADKYLQRRLLMQPPPSAPPAAPPPAQMPPSQMPAPAMPTPPQQPPMQMAKGGLASMKQATSLPVSQQNNVPFDEQIALPYGGKSKKYSGRPYAQAFNAGGLIKPWAAAYFS